MAAPKPSSETTLHLQRVVQASRERVFDAWARPEKFQAWFARKTDPPSCRFLVQDIHERGRYRFQANAPDGVRFLRFSKAPGGGRIDLVHAGVPSYDHRGAREGWPKYYWKPWRAYLTERRGKAREHEK